jgi:hypothetical protein
VTILSGILEKSNFLSKLKTLQLQMEKEVTSMTLSKYDKLDEVRLKGILQANKQCRHLKMGQVPFSPQLVMTWKILKAWKLFIKKLKGGKKKSRYFHRVMKAASISNVHLISVLEAEDNLANCRINYRRLKKEAPNLRATWLEGLASARVAQGNVSLAQEKKNLLTREQQRRDARLIRFSLASRARKGLCAIDVLDENNVWQEITEQNPMEQALLKELKTRFNQAANTPFQTAPLLDVLGPLGVSDSAKEILRGRFQPPVDIDEWATKLLPFLTQVVKTEQPADLSPEQHQQGWK